MKTNPKYHYHCNLKQGRNENFVLLTISHLKRLHGYGHQGLEDQWETKDGTSNFERYSLIDQILLQTLRSLKTYMVINFRTSGD
jgi:hypothetical protein